MSARLNQMKKYLIEALKNPNDNELYIEDLKLSIAMFETRLSQNQVQIMNGFVDVDETRT